MDEKRKKLQELRYEFAGRELDEGMVNQDPFLQFELWFSEAVEAKAVDPNAFTLATSGIDHNPDARIVLLKDYGPAGFSFFTNYLSTKGNQIEKNHSVCLNFFWPELFRQVRIRGNASAMPAEESDLYFATRPRGSQLSAWASEQSREVANREEMIRRFTETDKRFEGMDVPRPPHWGGYLVVPETIEFWQGRENRFHDRILYRKEGAENWSIKRLMP